MIKAEQVYNFLNNPFVQWNLKNLAKKEKDGRALVDHLFAAYAGQEKVKPKYLPYFVFISFIPGLVKEKPEKLKKPVCRPWTSIYSKKTVNNTT